MSYTVLLIEDDEKLAKQLTRFLENEGYDVQHATTGAQGVQLYGTGAPDLVLLDVVLPGGTDGLEVLAEIRKANDAASVIVMTAHASVETAVQAMRLGALDYLRKPIDLEELVLKFEQAKKLLNLKSDIGYLLERERRAGGFGDFVGECEAMRAVYQKTSQVAETDNTTVLITGESGTGKELVARAIHSESARHGKPLIQIDCTTIPLALMESELFGHERGAFSGADHVKRGLVELADRGTLLLDEIGDMDLSMQAKFLRVLEERRFRRVGGTRDLGFDVRVIAATNQDLDGLSKQGRFRRELLYRLKVFEIKLPPLRKRGDDILLLADVFIDQFARKFRKTVGGLDEEARQLLRRYPFPGNVRELRNIIEQAVILAMGDTITRELLTVPDRASDWPSGPPRSTRGGLALDALGDRPLEQAERELIRQALRRTGGNKKSAAALLGISRFALQRKLDKLEDDS